MSKLSALIIQNSPQAWSAVPEDVRDPGVWAHNLTDSRNRSFRLSESDFRRMEEAAIALGISTNRLMRIIVAHFPLDDIIEAGR